MAGVEREGILSAISKCFFLFKILNHNSLFSSKYLFFSIKNENFSQKVEKHFFLNSQGNWSFLDWNCTTQHFSRLLKKMQTSNTLKSIYSSLVLRTLWCRGRVKVRKSFYHNISMTFLPFCNNPVWKKG